MVTSSTTRQERRRAETERRILAAAMKLLREESLSELTVEQITEAADVGKGTFFNYFPNKEKVLLALFKRTTAEVQQRFTSLTPEGSAREQLTRFVHGLLQHPQRTPVFLRNVYAAAFGHDEVGQAFAEVLKQGRNVLGAMFAHGQRTGEVRADVSTAQLARNFQEYLFGMQCVWALVDREGDLRAWADELVGIFFKGIAATGPEQDTRSS